MAIWLGVGGGAWSVNEANCKALFDLGARDVQAVMPDLNVHAAELAAIKKFGMTATSDIEVPLWVNTGMNPNVDISWAKPQLQAQKNAGWQYFSSEGLGRGQVDVIRSVAPFLNYGSENGANMYAGQYNHATDSHYANLLESYHKWAINDYYASAAIAKQNSPRFGITLMMYAADLETDINALLNYIDKVGNVQEVLLWCGLNDTVMKVFSSPWIDIVKAIKAKYGFRTDTPWAAVTPPPPPPPPPQDVILKADAYTFVRGTNSAVYVKGLVNGKWTPAWTSIGGIATGAPQQTKAPDGTVFVFVRGSDGAQWYKSVDPTTGKFSAWATLSGLLAP
jgi:hypothetical protein